MWWQIFILFIVVSASTAINIRKIIGGNPNLLKCVPTLDMVDASGKIPSGILSGNLFEFGSFDQCLKIEHHDNKTGKTKQGKYCIVKIAIPFDLVFDLYKNELFIEVPLETEERSILVSTSNFTGIGLGWCVPHNCPIAELTGAITKFFQIKVPDFNMVPAMGGMCQTKEDLEINFSGNDIAIIAFLSTTGVILLISTIYDTYCHYSKKKPAHIMLIAFSVLTNGRKLLTVSKSPDQLGCLNGIRVISMMWVILAHKYLAALADPNINTWTLLTDWIQDPKSMFILNGTYSVDTFLLLSGLLVSYVFCLQMEKGIKFNIFSYYIHRYLRLTPVMAVIMWLHMTIVSKIGSGPLWPVTDIFKNVCVDYWWPNLLYIQNYYNPNDMCLGQTWYLSVDMHLYILSPILLLPLWKWPKYTMYSMVVLLLASMAIPFTVTYLNEIHTFPLQGGDTAAKQKDYYQATHTRYGPWLMGLMLGYYLFTLRKNRHDKYRLHPAEITFGWLVGLGLLGGTLYGPFNMTKGANILENSFMNGFSRHGWSLGVCWVIYACTQGYGGPINAFLSWSAFHVLARFSYTLYLIHAIVLMVMIASLRTVKYFSDIQMMYFFWGDFVASLIVSIALTLAYESPIITIEKVLFGKRKDNKKKTDRPKIGHTNKGFNEA